MRYLHKTKMIIIFSNRFTSNLKGKYKTYWQVYLIGMGLLVKKLTLLLWFSLLFLSYLSLQHAVTLT